MTFRVGQKVVCVDATPSLGWGGANRPVKGRVYTVRAVRPNSDDDGKTLAILLREVVNPVSHRHGDEYGFRAHRFRPVVSRKTDISIFKEILNTDHLDNRRRVVVLEPCPVDGWGDAP